MGEYRIPGIDSGPELGIDYGNGILNIDIETGIRYGVIHQSEVFQAWAESSDPYYGSPEEINEETEPCGFTLDDGEYLARSDEQGDIFVLKSPYFTYAKFCSPCAPGAVYLTNPIQGPISHHTQMTWGTPVGNNRGYCFGHDWFEDGKAPYTVYSVETGKEVI